MGKIARACTDIKLQTTQFSQSAEYMYRGHQICTFSHAVLEQFKVAHRVQ